MRYPGGWSAKRNRAGFHTLMGRACHPRRVTPEQTTAFVLGGGGILGAAEVGMLRALLEREIVPDLIVGSSVGALNGAFIAADPSTASVARMVDLWTGLSDRGVFGGSVFGQLSTLARHGTHLHANDGLRRLLNEGLGEGTHFDDLSVQVRVRGRLDRTGGGPLVFGRIGDRRRPRLVCRPGPAASRWKSPESTFSTAAWCARCRSAGPPNWAPRASSYSTSVGSNSLCDPPPDPGRLPWWLSKSRDGISSKRNLRVCRRASRSMCSRADLTAPTLSVRYRSTSGVRGRINAAYDAASSFLDGVSHR